MCGFLFYNSQKRIDQKTEKIIDNSERNHESRGPDFFKKIKIEDSNSILYFRRLSIIGLEPSSNQPLEIDGHIIMFNGEIYNYKEIKCDYLKDTKFISKSDTEVILRLYLKYGFEFFKKLSGIYSILIFDKKNKNLIIYRDPFGIKPLYYYCKNGELIISSQAKTINKIKKTGLDTKSAEIYKFFGNLLSINSIYNDIFAFEPGYIHFIDNKNKIKKIELENIFKSDYFNFNSNKEEIRNSLYTSIKENIVSDVDVSLFFSSGYDSNIIAENLPNKNFKLFTISTELNNKYQNEISYSKYLANFHEQEIISYEYKIDEINQLKKRFFQSMDQPTIDGLNTFLVSNLVKKSNIKVSLSGIGGDEYFGTYDTFKVIPKLLFMNKFLKNNLLKLFLNKFINKKKFNIFLKIKNSIDNIYLCKRAVSDNFNSYLRFKEILEERNINKEINEIINCDCSDRLKITLLELKFYCKDRLLRDVDWAGMTNSLEIRVPFLNKKFHQNICGYIFNQNNKIHKQDMIKNNELKKRLQKIKKQGFYVPYLDFQKNTKIDQYNYNNMVLENFN